jgi:hypothetical protein
MIEYLISSQHSKNNSIKKATLWDFVFYEHALQTLRFASQQRHQQI